MQLERVEESGGSLVLKASCRKEELRKLRLELAKKQRLVRSKSWKKYLNINTNLKEDLLNIKNI